ncbi:hypothetical protein [Algisphaera agarilytica]|uniref:Uncharacterized protein n=1 Tax=Algisphaera agarilytica TaxID=1385975 RepID=A0A7X0H4H4_9BACT|nr:hypothetical protein [Algisphaera agarilytica]MBB6429132.1 hypothetical protein [Algisphaera agarilytica]
MGLIAPNVTADPVIDGTVKSEEYSFSISGVGDSFADFFGRSSHLHLHKNEKLLFVALESGGNNQDPNAGVLYLDVREGGPSTTSEIENISGNNDQTYIAGNVRDSTRAADLEFAPGFNPDYALLFEFTGSTRLYPIIHDDGIYKVGKAESIELLASDDILYVRELAIPLDVLGNPEEIKLLGTVISNTAWRSNEFFGVFDWNIPDGSIGRAAFSLESGDYETFSLSISEPD